MSARLTVGETDMPIVFFKCVHCRREFNKRKDAEECEKAHLRPVTAKALSYTIKKHPYTIEVEFNDGSTLVYSASDLPG